MKASKRNRDYFKISKQDCLYNRHLIRLGATEYNLVEKLKLRMGGKHAAQVRANEEMADMPYWKMS